MFLNGEQASLAEMLGAHLQSDGGTRFGVWAPNALAVELVLGFEDDTDRGSVPLASGDGGIWSASGVDAPAGTAYRFAVTAPDGTVTLKTDPRARQVAPRPSACAIVTASAHVWGDEDWISARAGSDPRSGPLSVYEVHLGSWRRNPADPGRQLPFTELAGPLVDHVVRLGFTHVELLPITAHPHPDSWGYQATGYFAPDPRHGSPDDLRALIDLLHRHGVGVIVDWVPAHFATDAWALAQFDGTATYESGPQERWDTLAFDLGRPEVRAFLHDSARHWLEEFHVDGLRVDAVSTMLGDPSAPDPDAVSFLQELNAMVPAIAPGAFTIAEEEWPDGPALTPIEDGGLGFTFKWNLGWAADWLRYLGRDPEARAAAHREITNPSYFAGGAGYVLAISHDDAGEQSLWRRLWGDEAQREAGLRALLALQWAHPGKQSLFMGCEFAQRDAWSHHGALDWELLEADDGVAGRTLALVGELGAQYRARPALWSVDDNELGTRWIAADDAARSVYAFARVGAGGELLVCAANLSGEERPGYRLEHELLAGRDWALALDTSGAARVHAAAGDGLLIDLPPMTTIWMVPRD